MSHINIMERILNATRVDLEKGQKPPVPESHGVIVFKQADRALFYIRTNNLRRLYDQLTDTSDTPNYQRKMLEPVLIDYDTITFFPFEEEMEALVREKRLLQRETPEYHHQIRLYDQYCYLALSLKEPPYLSVKDDTTEELFFVGPFPERFILYETIEAFNEFVNTPACDGVKSPCLLLEEKKCPGYCLQTEQNELAEILDDYVLKVNTGLLRSLQEKATKLNENLEFEQAVSLTRAYEIIERFYQHLLFCHTAKYLTCSFTFRDVTYHIRQGLLENRSIGNKSESFNGINTYFTDYEDKERLAVPKENFREMWTIFKKILQISPEKIDEIYRKSLLASKKKNYWGIDDQEN